MEKKQTPLTKLLMWIDQMHILRLVLTSQKIKEKAIELLSEEVQLIKDSYNGGYKNGSIVNIVGEGNTFYNNEQEYFTAEIEQYNPDRAYRPYKGRPLPDVSEEDIKADILGFVMQHHGPKPPEYFDKKREEKYYSEQAVADLIFAYVTNKEPQPENAN